MPASASSMARCPTVRQCEPSAGVYHWNICIRTPFLSVMKHLRDAVVIVAVQVVGTNCASAPGIQPPDLCPLTRRPILESAADTSNEQRRRPCAARNWTDSKLIGRHEGTELGDHGIQDRAKHLA